MVCLQDFFSITGCKAKEICSVPYNLGTAKTIPQTVAIWQALFPLVPYAYNESVQPVLGERLSKYDIPAAAARQREFLYQVHSLAEV